MFEWPPPRKKTLNFWGNLTIQTTNNTTFTFRAKNLPVNSEKPWIFPGNVLPDPFHRWPLSFESPKPKGNLQVLRNLKHATVPKTVGKHSCFAKQRDLHGFANMQKRKGLFCFGKNGRYQLIKKTQTMCRYMLWGRIIILPIALSDWYCWCKILGDMICWEVPPSDQSSLKQWLFSLKAGYLQWGRCGVGGGMGIPGIPLNPHDNSATKKTWPYFPL